MDNFGRNTVGWQCCKSMKLFTATSLRKSNKIFTKHATAKAMLFDDCLK